MWKNSDYIIEFDVALGTTNFNLSYTEPMIYICERTKSGNVNTTEPIFTGKSSIEYWVV